LPARPSATCSTIATGDVWALVVLQQRGRGEFNYCRKEVEESMGPTEARCPARILDMLTPLPECDRSCARTIGESYVYYCGVCNAHAWRERCRANLERAAAQPSIKTGDRFRVARPWTFGDGAQEDTFSVVDGRRRIFRRAGDGRTVRLPAKSSWPTVELLEAAA
jgi:hypothetical protein